MPDCFDEFRKRLKNDFSEADIQNAINRTKDGLAKAKLEGANMSERLHSIANEAHQEAEFNESQKEFMWWRQQELINTIVKLISNFRGRKKAILKAVISYLDGSEFAETGARDSYSLKKHVINKKIIGALLAHLKKTGNFTIWGSKQYQEDIVHVMNGGGHDNPAIRSIGEALREAQSVITKLDNDNGIFYKANKDRFFKNFHSKKLMQYTSDNFNERLANRKLPIHEQRKIAFERWRDFVLRRLDIKKSFGEHLDPTRDSDEINKILSGVYDQLTDRKQFTIHHDDIVTLSRRHRVLIWKDAKGSVEYNDKFGTGHISSAIEAELQNAAKRNATLEHLSDKPIQTIQAAILRAEKLFPDLKGDFDKEVDMKKIQRLYLQARGVSTDPNSNWAKAADIMQKANIFSKLGTSFFRNLPDLAPTTQENVRIHGSFLKSVSKTIGATIQGMSKDNLKKFGTLLNSTATSNLGGNARTFMDRGDNVGSMSKMMRMYFKLGFHHIWDLGVKSGKAITEAKHLAINKDLSFEGMIAQDTEMQKKFSKIGALPPGLKNVEILKRYNIEGHDWDAFRTAPIRLIDGEDYLLPESAMEITEKNILKALKKDGISEFGSERIKKRLIERKRNEIMDKFESYIEDRIDYTIFRPSSMDTLRLFMNTEQGSHARIAMSLLNQFRMYGLTWVTKGLAPHIYGKGADSAWEALSRGKADYLSLVQMMAYSWAWAYAGYAATQLISGKSLPNPFDRETILRTAGEGLGGYMDAVAAFAEKREVGTYDNIFGANVSNLIKGGRVATNVLFRKWSGMQAWNFVVNNLPYHNMFWGKYGLDYLFLNRIREAIEPGYFEKRKRELAKHGQHYILPPL